MKHPSNATFDDIAAELDRVLRILQSFDRLSRTRKENWEAPRDTSKSVTTHVKTAVATGHNGSPNTALPRVGARRSDQQPATIASV
jgi:hypothetical protein